MASVECKQTQIIILGGGYYGLLSAILLSQNKQNEVHIIEQSSALGGLYRSAWSMEDYHFDYGSRCIVSTGIDALDKVLFRLLDRNEFWKQTDSLKEFSFQNGVKCEYSNCLDARLLPTQQYQTGLDELLSIDQHTFENGTYTNLEEFCNALYGKIFTLNLLKQTFEKLSGLRMNEAHPNALQTYGLHRIIIADNDQSKALKSSSSFNDSRIAFSSYNNHKSNTMKAYPIMGGLNVFVERISQYLTSASNVSIFLNATLASAQISAGKVDRITMRNGQDLKCDKLICTIPPSKIAHILDVNLDGLTPPKANDLTLGHVLFTGKIQTSAFYHYNYDQAYKIRRVTFYNNFPRQKKTQNFITVEMNHADESSDTDTTCRLIFDELITSGLIDSRFEILESKVQSMKNILIKPTIELPKQQKQLGVRFNNKVKNLTIVNPSVNRGLKHLATEFSL